MKPRIAVIFGLCLLGLPTPVLANAGTPLMWAGMFHLVFGNALIGVAEGALLARMFRLSYAKSIGLLVVANYFSAWCGGMFLRNVIVSHASLDLYNAWSFFWMMVAATYGMTLVLELPFVVVALRKKPHWFMKAFGGTLVVQSVSYIFIFGWYWMASGTSLYRSTEVVELSAMSLPEEVLVFYISAKDGDVYVRPLAGGADEMVIDLGSSDWNDRLILHDGSVQDDGIWDLVARQDTNVTQAPELISMNRSFSEDVVPEPDPRAEQVGTWFSFGAVPKLGRAGNSEWNFQTGFWPIEGLRGEREGVPDTRVGFSYETPFGEWFVRNAIHLPNDQVLFQLGTDQICVYDPETRQVALVVKGRGPTAVLKEEALSEGK